MEVLKSNNTLRICGDDRATNHLPVYASLVGSKVLSKLDRYLMHIHMHLNVAKESQEYLTINTHKGLNFYKELLYDVKSIPRNISGPTFLVNWEVYV